MNVRAGIPLRPDPDAIAERNLSSLVRACLAISQRAVDPTSRPSPSDYARKTWSGDRSVDLVLRAASSPAMTTQAGWAQELAPVTKQFLDLLVGVSAGAALLNRGIQVGLDGVASVSFPSMSTAQVGFTGQGKPIPVANLQSGAGVSLAPHAFKIIVTLTSEMLGASNAEVIFRTALLESAALSLDAALFSPNAATADAPAGLLNGVSATTPSTQTIPSEAMFEDLSKLGGAVARVAGNSTVFVAAPEQAIVIKLLAAPQFDATVLSSSALPAKTVIAIAPAALVSGYAPAPEIDASREATLHWDTAPAEIVGSGGVIASPVGSLFQSDKIGLRLHMPLAWVLRATNAIAYMNAVAW
jgi:hypothetical protein